VHNRPRQFMGECRNAFGAGAAWERADARGGGSSGGHAGTCKPGAEMIADLREEILMRAFIFRRVELIARGLGAVVILGSGNSRDSGRIREFLSRNGTHTRMSISTTDSRAFRKYLGQVKSRRGRGSRGICGGQNCSAPIDEPESERTAGGFQRRKSTSKNMRDGDHRGGRAVSGLSSAVYAAVPRVSAALVFETKAHWRQEGSSYKIENIWDFRQVIRTGACRPRTKSRRKKFRSGNDDREASREAKLRTQDLCD